MEIKINKKLKELRTKAGMTQEDFANAIGINLSSYQKYERDNNTMPPSLELVIKVADYCGVSTDYLLGRTEVKETAAVDPYTAIGIPKSAAELADRFNENFPKLPKEWQGFFCEVMRQTIEINKKAGECEVESVPEILPDIG